MRVVISSGLGRLHFIQAASALVAEGVSVELIQGWVPSRNRALLMGIARRLAKRPDLEARLAPRKVGFIPSSANHSCATAEFVWHAALSLSRAGVISGDVATATAWRLYGLQSRTHIRSQEIFHVRSGAGYGAIGRAKRNGLKVVVDHSIAHPRYIESTVGRFARTREEWLAHSATGRFWRQILRDCHAADLLLVNSHFVKETFVQEGFDGRRIRVAYLGVREDFWGLKRTYVLNSNQRRPELLFTGTFCLRKGALNLIETMRRLRAESPRPRLVVVGTWDDSRTMAKDLEADGTIEFVGHVPQDRLKDYLMRADLYVFPTLAEGCASSVMEALAAGLPVITTGASGVPSVGEKIAKIVPTNDTEALVAAIKSLLISESARAALGKAASALIARNYNWGQYAKRVKEVYQELACSTGYLNR